MQVNLVLRPWSRAWGKAFRFRSLRDGYQAIFFNFEIKSKDEQKQATNTKDKNLMGLIE